MITVFWYDRNYKLNLRCSLHPVGTASSFCREHEDANEDEFSEAMLQPRQRRPGSPLLLQPWSDTDTTRLPHPRRHPSIRISTARTFHAPGVLFSILALYIPPYTSISSATPCPQLAACRASLRQTITSKQAVAERATRDGTSFSSVPPPQAVCQSSHSAISLILTQPLLPGNILMDR